MANQRTLIRLARNAEDVASGLTLFRDGLPSQATNLTDAISELFAISAVLGRIDNAQLDPRQEPGFYRIEEDLRIVCPTLRLTLEDALQMFAREREMPTAMVWMDLEHRMTDEEGIAFGARLTWYHDFLEELHAQLNGVMPERLNILRRRLITLLDTQEAARAVLRRPRIEPYSAATVRPLVQQRISYRHVAGPSSPVSDGWDYVGRFAPQAPEVPISPTFTSSSGQTLGSSHTSYSAHGFTTVVGIPPPVHWATEVFDGNCPTAPFSGNHTIEKTCCNGSHRPDARQRLAEEGFLTVSEIDFDRGNVQVRLYWCPADNRSRILYMTKDSRGRDILYSVPLHQIRAIRLNNSIQLCRVSSQDRRLDLWARLTFVFYERMVLFYSTFVAMKHQDTHDRLPEALIEDRRDLHEEEIFGGVIRDGTMRHALRLYHDRSSGVVRLEASVLRGPREGVPIWTAFITRYARDPDWMALEHSGVVSLVAFKPSPYVFLAGYEIKRNRNGEYVLQFDTSEDATDFVQAWSAFCRNSRRRGDD